MPAPSNVTFCSSSDGTRLAMNSRGAGRDIVMLTAQFGDDLDLPNAVSRQWLDLLSPHARITRYDPRGVGLSDRDASRYLFDAWLEDLDAVLGTLGSDPVALIAHTHGAALAVHYASVHPHRVSHIVAYGGFVRGRTKRDSSKAQEQETMAQREAIRAGWGGNTPYSRAFRRVFLARFFPHASEEFLDKLDAATCRRWPGDVILAYSSVGWEIDVTEQARAVQCPSLIFHATCDQAVPLDEGRRLAALIPQARFVSVESDNHLPLPDDPQWSATMHELKPFLRLPQDEGRANGNRFALTPRQAEVLRMVAAGQTDKQIARALTLSPRTVEMHVGRALEALQCHTRAEGVRKAMELRLLD